MTRLTEKELQAALASHEYEDTFATDMSRTSAHREWAQAQNDSEDESAAAVTFWQWVTDHESQYPALRWLTHHEAGGYRPDGVAVQLQREGVRPGFPDYALYWANDAEMTAWAMELKRADRTNDPTDLQAQWLGHLAWEGWKCVVCYGADEAIAAIKEYLEAE